VLEALFGHGIAAVFDDDGLAMEFTDIRQRFGQDFGLDLRGNFAILHGKRAIIVTDVASIVAFLK